MEVHTNQPIATSSGADRQTPELPSIWRTWLGQPVFLKIVDLGLFAILVVAPFQMGGRQALGQLTLCVLATISALAWSLHQWFRGDGRWKFTGAEPLMLLGLGLIILQCCQLTPELMNAISPQVQKLLPEWTGTCPILPEVWRRISFTPSDTWSDFVMLVASLLFFFVAVQRVSTVEDLLLFVQIVAWGGGVMALFGLIQFSLSNGQFFWIYEHPMTSTSFVAKGAFTNANHFANYLAMSVPAQVLMIILRLRKSSSPTHSSAEGSRWKQFLNQSDFSLYGWSILLAITAAGILFSNSQNGVFAVAMGVLLTLAILWAKSMLSMRQTTLACGLLVGWLLLFPFLNAPAGGTSNFHLTKTQLKKLAAHRSHREIWNANIEGIREFPLAGTGLGSHHEVYWLWFDSPQDGREYSHSENGYLQIALETGLTGLGLVVLLWMTSLLWCAQGLWNATTHRSAGVMAVVTSGLLISLLQSITDFVWYVPACVNIVLLYAICAWRVSLMRFFEPASSTQALKCRTSSFGMSRLSWMGAVPVFMLLGGWMIREKLPELAAEPLWDEYLRMTMAIPASDLPSTKSFSQFQQRRSELAIAAAVANPRSQRYQLHAGLASLNQFTIEQSRRQHQMPLIQIRDAARSLFTSRAEMDAWLNRPGVLGAQRQQLEEAIGHFQASLLACPLQPRPYLELAELVWLREEDSTSERDLVEQAVTARPCDARAQFAMGRLLWLNGEQKEAAAHWQAAFRQDAGYRCHLIDALAAYVPARFFLDHFEPDHESLKQLRRAYRTSEDRSSYQLVLEALARSCVKCAMCEEGDASEAEWLLGHQCFVELGDHKGAYHCAKEAVLRHPQSFESHQVLGLWLYRNGRFAESVDELNWCLKRRPNETWMSNIEQDAQKKRHNSTPATQMAEGPSKSIIR